MALKCRGRLASPDKNWASVAELNSLYFSGSMHHLVKHQVTGFGKRARK